MLTRESMSFTPTLLAGMVSVVIARERADWLTAQAESRWRSAGSSVGHLNV